MKLMNRNSLIKIIITALIVLILIVPLYQLGVSSTYIVMAGKTLSAKYLIAGILFILGCVIGVVDEFGHNKDFQEFISTKILIDTTLIILTSVNMINPIITITVVVRDIVVDGINVMVTSLGHPIKRNVISKAKMICIMIGIALTLFYNFPFEVIGLRISDYILIVAAVLSVVSAVQYYSLNQKMLKTTQ